MKARYTLDDLRRLMQRLRDPETGCPWDLEQRFDTIVPFTLEEAYEVADAIERNALDELPGELGDLLFQTVFYAQLGSELGQFDLDDVIHGIVDKLMIRHPHVFPDGQLDGAVRQDDPGMESIKLAWEAQKASERAARGQGDLFDDVPLQLPALSRAQKVQKRARLIGFDWQDPAPVLDSLQSEVNELAAVLPSGDVERIADELGDVMFSAVSLARHCGLDAEQVCRQATLKFMTRIRAVQALARAEGVSLPDASSNLLDDLWNRVKTASRSTF